MVATPVAPNQRPVGGKCVNSTTGSLSNLAFTVNYANSLGPSGSPTSVTAVNSDTFAKYLIDALARCRDEWNPEACQVLGNLCVLQLFKETTDACQQYNGLLASRMPSLFPSQFDRPRGMPWLFYQEKPVNSIVNFSPNVTVDFASSNKQGRLSIALATYALNGTYLGMQPVKSQFEFCRSETNGKAPWQTIGYNYKTACKVNIAFIVNTTLETLFYDPFLIDDNGVYVPIPVRVYNVLGNKRSDDASIDGVFTDSAFTRRFFLIDNVSGVSSNKLQVLRLASTVLICERVRKVETESGKIYIPIMDIEYTQRTIDGPISLTDNSEYASPEFEFRVTYSMKLGTFYLTMQVLFSLATVVMILFSLYQARNWNKRNMAGPGDSIDLKFLGQLFVIAGQGALYVLLPNSSYDIKLYFTILLTALCGQTISVISKIRIQCKTDVFFLDWEKSKGKLLVNGNELSPTQAPVSVWRSIFMANQWNSLQTYRKVHVGFLLVWMYFILDGLDVKYAATPQPNISDIKPGARSPVLLFAVDFLIWLLLVVAQAAFRFLIFDRFYRDKLLQYADLLSVANVSLIIFDERCHGYYIHGRSVHPAADTNISELNMFLRKEEHDMVPGRGLENSEQQSFEIFLSNELRSTYDKIYGIVIGDKTRKAASSRFQRYPAANSRPKAAQEADVKAYETINKFFCAFFDKNLKELQYVTRPKTYAEKFIGAMPDVLTTSSFLHDNLGYSKSLLCGIEFPILIWYALIFIFIDLITDSIAMAAIIVFLIDMALVILRSHFGERNVSQKTLLDWKFLV
ncbi:Meckelin [Dinochytrium kinnereticum]|nr:Meckelin [Dinochytrium kinnereticum]